jgi:predicted DNA-binding transcriptional regulator AlpA
MSRLIRIEQAAEMTGYTVGTLHNYASAGSFPPPRERIGVVGFYAREDIRAFLEFHKDKGRPNARKSVRTRRLNARKR